MDRGESSRFLKFSREEAIQKVSLALKSDFNSKIQLWKVKDGRFFDRPAIFTNLKDFKLDTAGALKIRIPSFLMSQGILESQEKMVVTISLGLFVYIAECNLRSDRGDRVLEITSDLYREEGRENERLITYPHHKAYAYFFVPSEKSNLIFFKQEKNRELQINNNYFKTMQKKLWDKLTHEAGIRFENDTNILELRVSDISSGGFSVLANSEERDFLKNSNVTRVVLYFNSYNFSLGNLSMIYAVPFVDQKAITGHAVLWDKVGFSFGQKEEKLDSMLGHYITDKIETETRMDFLSYIKEHNLK